MKSKYKIEMIHNCYDPEGDVYYSEGFVVKYVVDGKWDASITIHEDEVSNAHVLGAKFHSFNVEEIKALRDVIKRKANWCYSMAWNDDYDYHYEPDHMNALDDIKLLKTTYEYLGFLRSSGMCLADWYRDFEQGKDIE